MEEANCDGGGRYPASTHVRKLCQRFECLRCSSDGPVLYEGLHVLSAEPGLDWIEVQAPIELNLNLNWIEPSIYSNELLLGVFY